MLKEIIYFILFFVVMTILSFLLAVHNGMLI